jgi:Peptidase family M48
MTGLVALVLAVTGASLAFGATAPTVARVVPARTAVWLLSVGSVVIAVSTMVVPAMIVLTALGQWPWLAGMGQWSAGRLARSVPFGGGLFATALAVGVVQVFLALAWARSGGRRLVAAWGASRRFDTSLVVVADGGLEAFALPGWPGRVVAGRALLQALDPVERRAVLAHEQAHLDQRHDLHRAAAALAARVDPLLYRVPAALGLATERWADETAARYVGDRAAVARTIEAVASVGRDGDRFGAGPAWMSAMHAGASDVALRVALLGAGPRPHRLRWEAALVGVVVLAGAAALVGLYHTKELFETAEHAYLRAAGAR